MLYFIVRVVVYMLALLLTFLLLPGLHTNLDPLAGVTPADLRRRRRRNWPSLR